MKQLRLDAILELIREYPIETQEELQQRLKQRGYEVTQATVSRDIKKLRLMKTPDESGRYRYTAAPGAPAAPPEQPAGSGILPEAILRVDSALNDVVVKCRTGMAQAACAVLDEMALEHVVGSIAGDDTIFIVTRGEEAAQRVRRRIETLAALRRRT